MDDIPFSWSEIPERLRRVIEAGRIVRFSDAAYTLGPSSGFTALATENDEAEHMTSLRKNRTGVDNTIFVSTKGYAQHAAGIKIAIDPPDSLSPTCKTASMAIHDFGILGEHVPRHIAEQAEKFIERNREALISYWNYEFDTAELLKRLKQPIGKARAKKARTVRKKR